MSDRDTTLVQKAQNGDRTAFEELVRRTSRLVFARLYLETGDSHRAEDLLQETLLRAFRSMRTLEKPDGFRAWLLAIAQNVLLDDLKRDARQKRTPGLMIDPGAGSSPEKEAQREEIRQKVLAVLRSLPEEHRLPLTLRYLGGADYDTISTQLGLTNGSLRGLLHRGLKMLRDRLPPELGAELNE